MNRAERRRLGAVGKPSQTVCVIDNSASAKDDWIDNPLLKYPVALPCFCGSKIIYRMCCMSRTLKFVAPEKGKLLKKYMDDVFRRIDEATKTR